MKNECRPKTNWGFSLGLLKQMSERRTFEWVSSVSSAKRLELAELSTSMETFYSHPQTRSVYQGMVDSPETEQPMTEGALRQAILDLRPSCVLEVGCGSGRIYQRLRQQGYRNAYTGVELSADVIAANRQRFPEATWVQGTGYDLPVADASLDCAFAYYVLEHCVYPERFLTNVLRIVREGGSLILAFPHFPVSRLFGSQRLGLSEGNAGEHLRAARILHALVALYDSRVRLPRALCRARGKVGPFTVNLRPKCFAPEVKIEPDVDAVYIASRAEILEWAATHALKATFPGGQDGVLRSNVLVKLTKVNK